MAVGYVGDGFVFKCICSDVALIFFCTVYRFHLITLFESMNECLRIPEICVL